MKSTGIQAVQKPTTQVFERLFNLIHVLANCPEPMSLKRIAEITHLHASTVHRLLSDLMLEGYVDRPRPGYYQLGMRFLELGNIVKSRLDVRQIALPFMQSLHMDIGHPVSLSLRQGDEIVYIERTYNERSGMQVVRAIGGRAPLHLTSVGKLFLAQDKSTIVKNYCKRTQLIGNTANSIRSEAALRAELRQVQKTGIAYDKEELERGVQCMACGIYDDNNTLIAGLSISTAASAMRSEWSFKLQQVANQISERLGNTSRTATTLA